MTNLTNVFTWKDQYHRHERLFSYSEENHKKSKLLPNKEITINNIISDLIRKNPTGRFLYISFTKEKDMKGGDLNPLQYKLWVITHMKLFLNIITMFIRNN